MTLTRSKSSGDAPADTAAVAPLGSGPAPAGSPAVPSASPSPKPSAIPKAVGGCTRPAGATPKTTVTVVKVGTTVTGYGQQADTDPSWTTRIVWDPRAGKYVETCATDNGCRIAQPSPYRTVATGTCDGTLFGGDLVLVKSTGTGPPRARAARPGSRTSAPARPTRPSRPAWRPATRTWSAMAPAGC